MKRFRSQKGAALLEAAVTIPLILLISVGIFEFGRAYQTSQVLTNAAREGARLAVIEGSTDADIRTRVRKYLEGGGLKYDTTSLPDSTIVIARNVDLVTPESASRVEIHYPFEFIMLNSMVRMIVPGDKTTGAPITMTAATVMRNE
jgi:Flp pilus assembly protein TadG